MRRTTKPVSATGRPIEPDQAYCAWQGFATWALDQPVQIKAGTVVRGVNPVVRVCAAQFVEANLPHEQWPPADKAMLAQVAEQGLDPEAA